MSNTTSNKPVKKIRVGNVSATIWEQESGFYNATLERNYKDRDGKWKSTNSFSVHDLVVVAKVANMAADAIIALGTAGETDEDLSSAA